MAAKAKVGRRREKGSGGISVNKRPGVKKPFRPNLTVEPEDAVVGKGGKLVRRIWLESQATRAEAKQVLADALAAYRAGKPLQTSDRLLQDVADEWLTTFVEPYAKLNTFKTYRSVLDHHLLAQYGRQPIGRLTLVQLQERINQVHKAKSATGLYLHGLIVQLWAHAEKIGILDRNVAQQLTRPKHTPQAGRSLSTEQARLVVRHAPEERYGIAFLFGLFCGLRIGEVLALRPSRLVLSADPDDLTLLPSLLTINATQVYRTIQESPKTPSSVRVVAIPRTLDRQLRQHLHQQRLDQLKYGWRNDDPTVICNAAGEPMRPDVIHDALHAFQARLGLPQDRFHTFRHSWATGLMREVSNTVISQLAGHSNPALIAQVYQHPDVQDVIAAANAIDRIFA